MLSQRKAWTIYGIIDPTTAHVRYVGYTSLSPAARLKRHLQSAFNEKSKLPVHRWLRSLAITPQIIVLESGDDASWHYREKWWIAHFRLLNPRMLNLSDGGYIHIPDESRKRAAKKLKNRRYGPEYGKRISEAKKGKPRKDRDVLIARCKEMAARNTGKKMLLTAEERLRRSEAGKISIVKNCRNWRASLDEKTLAQVCRNIAIKAWKTKKAKNHG